MDTISLLAMSWLPWAIAAALLVVAVLLLVVWRREVRRGARAAQRAAMEAAAPDPAIAELERRDRIAHDALVGTATSVTAAIDRADSVVLTATQDPDAAARIARGVVDQLRIVRDDLRRVADLVAPDLPADATTEPTASELVIAPLLPTVGATTTSMTQLAVRARDAGLTVRVETVGEPFAVPAPFAAGAMRIVELALENAAVHAGAGATAVVVTTWTDDALRLAIEDDGVRAAARRAGLDPDAPHPPDADERLTAMTGVDGPVIAEMRERTAAYDGVFAAAPVPGIGFTVTATFPGVRRAPIEPDDADVAG
jgi:signal transduction histidine kinase